MKRKIIVFFILTLFITSFTVNSEMSKMLQPGVDQEQTIQNGTGLNIETPNIAAQSFKPTVDKLTAVQLYFFSADSVIPDPGGIITVSIRDNFQGEDLTSVSVSADSIGDYNWLSFDFPDIDITPGNTYIILCQCTMVTFGTYAWFMGKGNPYDRGDAYSSSDNGESWNIQTDNDDADLCFKTWYTEKESNNIELKLIKLFEEYPNIMKLFRNIF